MSPLAEAVAAELDRPLVPDAAAFAAWLAERAGGGCLGVLFYGSALRTGDTEGLLDFYVLLDRADAWPQPAAAAWAMERLAPNVEYHERPGSNGGVIRAKTAILTLDRFEAGVRTTSLDTSLWARFAQPCALAWRRDQRAADRIAEAVAEAVRTAAGFAAALGPETGPAADYWAALFRATYAAELRVEDKSRPRSILGHDDARYATLLPMAWREEGTPFGAAGEALKVELTPADRAARLAAWRKRRSMGRPFNVARLVKAAFTFEGAADYVAWKVERHTGYRLPLTPWRRRHPLLSSPWALWRLWRAGVLR